MKNFTPVIISKIPTQKEVRFLEDMIYEHNASKTNRKNGKLFSKLIYDPGKKIIAGITGWTWAGACEITLLWVKEEYTRKGFGKILLKAAEAEAKKEKCKTILLRSYSFQAPLFYQKFGYKVEFETKDFPDGHSYFCLIKRLTE
jgi:GNAT superfamily N-acetyltransferase